MPTSTKLLTVLLLASLALLPSFAGGCGNDGRRLPAGEVDYVVTYLPAGWHCTLPPDVVAKLDKTRRDGICTTVPAGFLVSPETLKWLLKRDAKLAAIEAEGNPPK